MAICLIKQPAGIGDIFLCQKIAKTFINAGYEVIWPIYTHLLWLKDYIKYPNMTFIDINDNFFHKDIFEVHRYIHQEKDFIFLPLHTADQLFEGLILDSKFKLVNMSIQGWQDYFEFERNMEKENHLFYDILGLTDSDDFLLSNPMYGTPPHYKTVDFNFQTDKKVVQVNLIEGITIFDWCKTLEKASSIHFVDSSFSLIMDKINLKNDDINIYARLPKPHEPTFKQTQHIFKPNNWKWVQL